MYPTREFMIFYVFLDCTTLPNLTMFDPSADNNKSTKSLSFYTWMKKRRCRNVGSLHYKRPERQNKPDDGASPGRRAIQQPAAAAE